jgi:ATP-binding cassette, subfamily B, bacterial
MRAPRDTRFASFKLKPCMAEITVEGRIRTNKEILSRVARLFKPYRRDIVWTILAVILGTGLGILPPLWMQTIIDVGIIEKDFDTLILYSLLVIAATLAGALFTLLYGYLGVVVGQKIMCDLRRQLFSHLQGMPLKFFTSTRTGEIQTRLISDVQGVQTVVSTTLVDMVSNVAIVVQCLAAMFYLDWRLTLLSIGMVPIFGLFGRKVGDFARDVRKNVQETTEDLNSTMQETLSISGMLLTKTTGRSDVILSKFEEENQALARWQVKQQLLQYMFFGLIRLITSLAPALVYLLAGYLLFRGDENITAGMLAAFVGLQIRMFFPITGLLGSQVEILSSYALFDRLFQYLDLPREIEDRPEARALLPAEAKGAVAMRDVHFRYPEETDDWTLAGLSFEAEPGQLVALVGPSGAGKTTLTYLIPRLYDVERGKVLLDGVDVREIRLSSLQELVGVVTQETYMLHASVADNLRVAKPDASQQELEEACRLAAIHETIESLEHGYETLVGERGYKLSGGEKQRLAIARAILKNPKILILDEATSALDTRSERMIQRSLKKLMEGRTTFAIAHRLSTILEADQILVIASGTIVERGRHAELLAQEGVYAQLYREQFLHEPGSSRAREETAETAG